MDYKVHICGTAEDNSRGFHAGFDLTVENGGSVEQVASAIQSAINIMADKAVSPLTTAEDKPNPA